MTLLVFGGLFREVIMGGPGQREVRFAGSALYAASAAARLGAPVTMVAPVGSDDLELSQKLAAEAGINAELVVGAGASGTFAYERRGRFLLPRGYRPADSRPALDLSMLSAAPRLSLLFGHPEHDPTKSAELGDLVSGGSLLFDRQGWMSATPALASALRVPAMSRIALANTGELAEELSSVPDLDGPLPDGWETLIAKDGRWGVHLLSRGHRTSMSAYRVDAVSELGSGDVFAGAIAAGLLEGLPDRSAVRAANAAAAAAVSSPDALPGADFVPRIKHLLDSGETRTVIPPLLRAQVEICLDAPRGFAGDAVLDRLTEDLRAQGFAPSVADRTVAVPSISTGDEVLELTDSGLDPMGWLHERLLAWR